MKTTRRLLFAAVALAIVLACDINPNLGMGSMSLQFAFEPVAKSTANPRVASDMYIRVYLVKVGGAYYPLAPPTAYIEVLLGAEADSQEVTVEELPPGKDYTLIVIKGAKTEGSDFFAIEKYDVSDPFSISAGVETPVSVEMQAVSLVSKVAGKKVPSIVQIAGTYYALVGGDIQVWSQATQAFSSIAPQPTVTVNSLSIGKREDTLADELWLNTDGDGIVPYRDETYVTDFSSKLLEKYSTVSPLSVYQSGAYTYISSSAEGLVIYYLREDGLGGAVVAKGSSTTEWEWFDISEVTNLEGFEELGAILSGRLVHAIAISDNGYYAYIATVLNTYRVSEDIEQKFNELTLPASGIPTFEQVQTLVDVIVLGSASAGTEGEVIQITSLAQAGDSLFLGTTAGMFRAKLDSGGNITAIAFVEGTQRYSIFKIDANQDAGGAITAVGITKSKAIVANDTPTLTREHAFFDGLPGELKDVVVLPEADTYFLAGTEGLVLHAPSTP